MELLSSPNGLIGHVSPLAVLSLEAEELRQMGVSPERARFYSFFYPCPQLAGCMLSSEKPLQALVTKLKSVERGSKRASVVLLLSMLMPLLLAPIPLNAAWLPWSGAA